MAGVTALFKAVLPTRGAPGAGGGALDFDEQRVRAAILYTDGGDIEFVEWGPHHDYTNDAKSQFFGRKVMRVVTHRKDAQGHRQRYDDLYFLERDGSINRWVGAGHRDWINPKPVPVEPAPGIIPGRPRDD
jgi:hypothetical protein